MPRDKRGEKPEWYPLDNAGVLYSALQKEKYSAIYRFSAVMAERVDRDALQRAVDKTMPRFPSFGVRIKKGAFWYYFEPNSAPGPFVKEDISNPCQPVRFREDNGWLVRFYYYEKRISVEVFHAVSDGGGALVFFKTLLAVYLRELGYSIPNTHGILDVAEEPRRAEREDAYGRYATVRPGGRSGGKGLPEQRYGRALLYLQRHHGLLLGGPAEGEGQGLRGVHHGVPDCRPAEGDRRQAAPGAPPAGEAGGAGHTYQPAGLVSLGNPAQLHFDGAALHRPLSGRVYL